jgi:hypothetical protein
VNQAQRLAGRTGDVGDGAADAADEVVVVVAHARFEARGAAGRFDPAREPDLGKRAEDVVDGLDRDGTDPRTSAGRDVFDRRVRALANRRQHRETRCGDAQARVSQASGVVALRRIRDAAQRWHVVLSDSNM